MNAVIPGIGVLFIEAGDGAQALDKLLATMLIRITQSITFGAGEYLFRNASARLVARRAAQSAQRQAGGLPIVNRMLLIKAAPVFSGLVILYFRDTIFGLFCRYSAVSSAPANDGSGPGSIVRARFRD